MDRIRLEVAQLLRKVPKPPNYSLPEGASENELAYLSKILGYALPIELGDWLRTSNGPLVGPGGVYGVPPAEKKLLITEHLKQNSAWQASRWIPVAGDGNGNTYVLDATPGIGSSHSVYFVDHEDERECYRVASNLWLFLRFLFLSELARVHQEKPHWPFDKSYVLHFDPAIAMYSGAIVLPWE